MFGKIKQWFKRRRQQRERNIFRFWDGSQWLGIDPMKVEIGLDMHDSFSFRIGEDLVAGDGTAVTTAAQAVRDVFGVQELDPITGAGLTLEETLEILYNYLDYCEVVKKKSSPGLISPAPTDPRHSTSPADPSPATNSSSDSISTPPAQNCAAPQA